mgnify:FL=1
MIGGTILKRKAIERGVLVISCLMLMTLGFFNTEVAAMMNGPAWMTLALIALFDR